MDWRQGGLSGRTIREVYWEDCQEGLSERTVMEGFLGGLSRRTS